MRQDLFAVIRKPVLGIFQSQFADWLDGIVLILAPLLPSSVSPSLSPLSFHTCAKATTCQA